MDHIKSPANRTCPQRNHNEKSDGAAKEIKDADAKEREVELSRQAVSS